MIPFFRKIRATILSEGKTGKYLKYAIGEILLVVIGILIALQINNWNEYRKERIEADKILREINRNLVIDINEIDGRITRAQIKGKNIEKLLSLIKQDSVLHGNATDKLFGAVFGINQFSLNITPFQTLNSKGINLISDDSLKMEIIRIFEDENRILEFHNNAEKTIASELIWPYYMNNFKDIAPNTSATPNIPEEVVKDAYYVNIIETKLRSISQFLRDACRIQSEMIKLKEMIDKHFGET